MNLPFLLLLIAAYLIGSIPFALLASKCKGLDIRTLGSGNVGATNVFRCVGKGWGIATLICDALKGFLPVFFALPLYELLNGSIPPFGIDFGTPHQLLVGFMAILGHNWPVFLKFKGGKGVATTLGVIIGLAPHLVLVGLAVFILVIAVTRYVSAASMAGAIGVAAGAWYFREANDWWMPISFTILALLIVLRHKTNISRLIKGEESRISFAKMKK